VNAPTNSQINCTLLQRGEIEMPQFIKGLELSESFFNEIAKCILDEDFPNLQYTAGLIGYGSDVLGFDDETSTDHMWGPRFYLFIKDKDKNLADKIMNIFSKKLPYTYKGYSVNFSKPNPNDNGVRVPQLIESGDVHPLIFIETIEDFLEEYLGVCELENMTVFEWLSVSEHKLLALTSGKLFIDMLDVKTKLESIKYYPEEVKLYLIASQWSLIAEEQAFVKRCGSYGDDIGSRIICSRIVERLMRLCFLYCNRYAPYSKWFGTAFDKLIIPEYIKKEIKVTLSENDIIEREFHLVNAQALIGELHNSTGLTDKVSVEIQSYFNRDIKVIFADKFAEITKGRLIDSPLYNIQLIGTLNQVGNFTTLTENKKYNPNIKSLYSYYNGTKS
jgi:hypothetical protein